MTICWLRRDLRLEDNVALHEAIKCGEPVLLLFIFDKQITQELPEDDARISFIHEHLTKMDNTLKSKGSSMLVQQGEVLDVFKNIIQTYSVKRVFANRDYEPYALSRDQKVETLLEANSIQFKTFKDQVIFEPNEVLKSNGTPYLVFTPYKRAWLKKRSEEIQQPPAKYTLESLYQHHLSIPSLADLGFKKSTIRVPGFSLKDVVTYHEHRDFPDQDKTSYIGPHLRFGTVGIRSLVQEISRNEEGYQVFLSEIIWRSFFKQIMFHYPRVISENFKKKYNGISWRNDPVEFEKWCTGNTGYPMVDAGMRQLNETGFMHNRARMITSGFLCKHLLIDWRWGEAYFAKKLLDYDLSSNNGNWQWAAGTGCDAAPYFRVFNPSEQLKKFDKQEKYVRKWIKEYGTSDYPRPMVDHKQARLRALEKYKEGMVEG